MSFRSGLLSMVDGVRALRGPEPVGLDIETVQLSIVRRTWTGGRRGAGLPTDVALVLPQRYKIRQISEKLIASTGGRFETGDMIVGPVTPAYEGGGYTPAELKPVGSPGVEIVYVLSGASTGEYALVNLDTTRPFRYELTLRRVSP